MRFIGFFAAITLTGLSAAWSDPHPDGFREYELNGPFPPVTEGGVTTFQLQHEQCSAFIYGDGRGESDCLNGNLKSVLKQRRAYKLGESVEYRFDVWIDPELAFPGEYDGFSIGYQPGGWDSALRIANWEDERVIKSYAYLLKVDARNGISLLGQQCQSPERFGEWVSVSLKVRWANDDRGWAKFTCDDQIVYNEEDLPTILSRACYVTNECQPDVEIRPTSMSFIVGLAINGHGYSWKERGLPSQFRQVQPGGIFAKVRNLEVTTGARLYESTDIEVIRKLQVALNGLGCDVGAADGIAGKKTKQAALTCRQFADGEMPPNLTVATATTFLDLYTGEGVAALAAGSPSEEQGRTIRIGETHANHVGGEVQIASNFGGDIFSGKGKPEPLKFMILGLTNAQAKNIIEFTLLVDYPIDMATAALVKSCAGGRVGDWGPDGLRGGVRFTKQGDEYQAVDPECVVAVLPKDGQRQADFLLDHFAEIAANMAKIGSTAVIKHDGLRTFMERAATGEIMVGR